MRGPKSLFRMLVLVLVMIAALTLFTGCPDLLGGTDNNTEENGDATDGDGDGDATDGDGDATDGDGDATDGDGSDAVTISASGDLAEGGTHEIGGSVTFTATITDANSDTVNFAWTVIGPSGELDVNGAEGSVVLTETTATTSVTLVPLESGDYTVAISIDDDADPEASFSFSAQAADGDGTGTIDEDVFMRSGIESMEELQFGEALAFFDAILQNNPNNVSAAIAYSLIDIGGVITSESVVELARNDVGITEYPSTLQGILDYEAWTDTIDPYGDIFPEVRGQQDYNGDGTIDVDERFLQGVRNLGASSLADNGVVDAFAGGLISRVGDAITRLDAIDASGGFDITYRMVYETEAEALADGWPKDGEGNAAAITIGAAELDLLVAQAQIMMMFNHLARVMDLSYPWTTYLEDRDGNIRLIFDESTVEVGDYLYDFPALGVLESNTFLALRDNAEESLSAAGEAFGDAVSRMSSAVSDIADRSGDFFLNTDELPVEFWDEVGATGSEEETFLDNVAATLSVLDDKVQDSLANNSTIYFPNPDDYADPNAFAEEFKTEGNWPSNAASAVVGVNFGEIFGEPEGAISSVLELQSETREPVYYVYEDQTAVEDKVSVVFFDTDTSTYSGGYTNRAEAESAAETASFKEASGDFDAEIAYFIKIPDATLSAITPANSLDQADLQDFNVSANVIENEIFTESGPEERWEFDGHYFFAKFEGESNERVSVYIQVPNFYVGHSKTAKGETFEGTSSPLQPDSETDQTEQYTSVGDFWWAVLVDIGVISQK